MAKNYFILPQSKLLEFYRTVHASGIDAAELHSRQWWTGVPAPRKSEIRKILPALRKGIKGIEVFGNFMGNKLSLTYDDSKWLTDFHMRVDMSRDYWVIRRHVEKLTDFVRRSGYAFLPAKVGLDSILIPKITT